jgi:hypothetical protein
MKTIWAILFALIGVFGAFEYQTLQLEKPTLVETKNTDLKYLNYNNDFYLMSDRDLQDFHTMKIREELHTKELYLLTR